MNAQLALPGYEHHRRQRMPAVADIQREVADYFSIPVAEMVSQRRARSVARPRQVAMYLAKQRTRFSLPAIGGFFGHRDHTTVLHAVRQIERLMGEDQEFADAVRELDCRL